VSTHDEDPFAKYHRDRIPARLARGFVISVLAVFVAGGLGYLALHAASSARPTALIVVDGPQSAAPDDPVATPASPSVEPPIPATQPDHGSDNAVRVPAPVPDQIVDPAPTSPNWTFLLSDGRATTALTIGSCISDEYDLDSHTAELSLVSCQAPHDGVVSATAALQDPAPTDQEAMAFVGPLCFPSSTVYTSTDAGDSYHRYNEWHRFDNPKPMTQWYADDSMGNAYRAIRTIDGYLCLSTRPKV
jgi:hypothetical protein